jgi:hypothetical protein
VELRVTLTVVSIVAAASTQPARAQTDVTLEVGASQMGPSLGDDADGARFGVGGIRASHYTLSGSGVAAGFLFGHTIGGQSSGDFFSASLGGSLVDEWGGGWAGGMDVRLLGFGIRAPYPYRAVAAEGGPLLRFSRGTFSVTTAAVAGIGRSRIRLWRVPGGRGRLFFDDLWRLGGTTEILFGSADIRAGVAAGVHETTGGTFSSGGGRVIFLGGQAAIEVRADVWRTPAGTDVIGGVEFVIPLAGWSLRGFLGRSEPDPLTLAAPGSGSAGFLVGRSVVSRGVEGPAAPSRYEIVEATARGARVRIRVEAPANTERVAVLGDFTLWEPVAMTPRRGGWEAELEVPAGTHHYGFLADGEWYLPEDEPSAVPDEWGRMSAILVIEAGSRES